jgi:cysteine desulfuration protein SufE
LSAEAIASGRLLELVEPLSTLDRAQRIEALLDLASRFREVDPAVARRPFPEANRVPACESQAFVFPEPLADGTLRFHFAVENPQGLSAKALAVLLDRAFSGAPLAEVAAGVGDPAAAVEAVFGRELSLGKQLGLAGLLLAVQRAARARLALAGVDTVQSS